MKAVRCHRFGVVALVGLVFASAETAGAQQKIQPKDLMAGASSIFKSPQSPPVGRRRNQQRDADAPQEKSKTVATETSDDPGDKVEDALALGNAARDRKPPDLGSAERAYRLAWKLNPNDPRPYVGLGNVYFDQQRYPEAAKSYRDAIRLKETRKKAMWGGLATAEFGTRTINPEPRQLGELYSYLATAMLEQENWTGAESELRRAVAIDSNNATRRAQIAYTLVAQKRYTEAAAFYESAVRLDSQNDRYKGLLEQAVLVAQQASAEDHTIVKQMEGTRWEIRDAVTGDLRGTCHLQAEQRLACTASSDKESMYGGLTWKVQDGLFELESAVKSPLAGVPTLPQPSCVGEMRADRIYIKCPLLQIERADVWTKLEHD